MWIKQPLSIWITVYLSIHSRNKAHSTIVVMKLWINENHVCELRSEELDEVWSFNFFFFFSLSFRNCKSCVYNCHDHPSFNSSLRSSHIWFSYIHNFIIIFFLQVYNEPIQRPAPSWLVSLTGRTPHRYRRSQGFESRTSFFRLSFRNCKSCV